MRQVFGFLQDTVVYLFLFLRGAYRSIRENTGLAAVSVVLAFGIWMVVVEADNPTSSRVVPEDLTIEPINVPSAIAVVDPNADPDVHVRVRVAVSDEEFDSLTKADFEATIDLAGYTVGEYEVPVEVRPLTSRGGLRVESVIPEQITVTLAQLNSKEVPVKAEVTGDLVSGYTMSPPELEDTSVIVSGPQSEVDKVTQATAEIDVGGQSRDIDQAVRLVARDANGDFIPGVRLNPDLTNIKIEVEQQKFTRSMAVSVDISDSPADGYNVVSVSVSPATVTIRGDEAFIAGTSSIATKPVSVEDATEDVVKTVSLELPPDTELAGGVPVVTVTIRIAAAQGRFSFSVPITVTELGDDVAVDGALPSVTVTLEGPIPQLRAVGPSDIAAVVNLGGEGPGTHTEAVEVAAPSGSTVVQVSPASIDVTLVLR